METASTDDAEATTCAECPLEHLYTKLNTNSEGLTTTEAAKRLEEHGPNVLPKKRKRFGQNILVQFRNLFNILLIVAAVLSFISGFTSNDMGSINMGIVILVVVFVSIVFNLLQEHRAEKAVEAIRELIPVNAKVKRNGQTRQIEVSEIVPGDILILEAGDKISADARVIDCYELTVDNSSLTGESEPVVRSTTVAFGASRGEVANCVNIVFAGTTVVSGSGTALVIATGLDTEFGRVVKLTQAIEELPSPLQVELNRTAKLNFIVAIVVGFLFLLIAFFGLHLQLAVSLLFMIGVMVCLVPEGFQITLTLALALSSLAMSKRNVVVKRLASVETLGSATVVCADKTGTITEGQMTVRKVWIGGSAFDVTGEGYEPEGSILYNGNRVLATERKDFQRLCDVASLDNMATLVPPLDRRKSRWTAIGDSTEAALLVLVAKAGVQHKEKLIEQPRIGMIPFESKRKMMTSIHKDSDGNVTAYVKGAGIEILSRCTHAFWNETIVSLTDHLRKEIVSQIDAFARDAYRVLALALRTLPEAPREYKSELIEADLTFIGLVAIFDPPRSETPEAVRMARTAGTKVIMLTGDHELTAEAIARHVGIITSPNSVVMTGYALAKTSDEELNKILDRPEIVFARISPDQKLRVVRMLRAKGETVAVTGDGVNDAPALLEADIGIAMGLSGTDVARESADMVLLDDNFASIVNGIEQGRCVFDNLKKFIVYVFAHNWAEFMAFIAFVFLGIPLPLAVVQVLAIDLMMDIPPSLALTVEPPEPGIMERLPRPRGARLFNISALARSTYIGVIIGVAALFWCFQAWSQAGWAVGMSSVPDNLAYLRGTTFTMAAIMAGQLGTLFATRTNVKSTFSLGLERNKWLLAAVLVSILVLLAIIYVPFFNSAFVTAPVPPFDLVALYAVAPVVLLIEEVRKYILRSYFLPAIPVMAKPVLPLPTTGGTIAVEHVTKRSTPFVETAAPTVVPLFLRDFEENAVRVAADLGKSSGSRLIFIRIIDEKTANDKLRELEHIVEECSTRLGVPYEYLDLRLTGKESTQTTASSLREAIKGTAADRILLPVSRNVFAGRKSALRKIRWIEGFSEKRVALIANWKAMPIPSSRGPRILIPALSEFQGEPFEVAEALTQEVNFPDVDIVAAKVVELPRIVPLYSIYRPESLVDVEQELSTFRSLPRWAVIRRIRPMVLLVRETGRDLTYFAEERNVDLIIMEGKWAARRHGFLPKKERAIAAKAQCTVVVTLPPGVNSQ